MNPPDMVHCDEIGKQVKCNICGGTHPIQARDGRAVVFCGLYPHCPLVLGMIYFPAGRQEHPNG